MKKTYTLIATCHFGLEAVLKREIIDIGYEITEVRDGRVSFIGDDEAIVRANLCLRTAERVLLLMGSFTAVTFEEYFDKVAELPWEEVIPEDGKFYITKASSVKSKLFSPRDLQSLGKKAIVKRMSKTYKRETFPETGVLYPIRVFFMKDEATVALDTTGASLHKRGYRTNTAKAPISETLAAALLMLTPWRDERSLLDPFCGSGTFCIEAAMRASHIAPGLDRSFNAEEWVNIIDKDLWKEIRTELRKEIITDPDTDIQGYDIDEEVVHMARENAKNAGVDHLIHFQVRDVKDTSHRKPYGFIITNPPYGERISEKEDLPRLYKIIGDAYKGLDKWSMYVITSYEDAEKYIGRKADKNRKLYNGMIKTYFYEFRGEKPPKRKAKD